MKKISVLFLLLLFVLVSNSSIFKKEWVITKKENIILFTRPENYTSSPSPTLEIINEILEESIYCVNEINKELKVNYTAKVKIYLYNFDEAKEQIGTNGGGGAIPSKRSIYYTYFEIPRINIERNRTFRIGLHEFVHIISFNEIGDSKTLLFTEGYANAISGTYSAKEIEDKYYYMPILDFINAENLQKPTDLLNAQKIIEGKFYPQSGFFLQWLFKIYGVDKVNKLFVLKRDGFEKEFEKVTGDTFGNMEEKYLSYCKSFFKE
ncbi:MAG: hypothetical protein A2W98_03260 [Bacteroidetes bacterium GWF2_33_38]|nr:MAG: hypothetical protein A2W98_03260 [Bacteroidetes bacterium GWF2_33_38]OFY72300.1 MAG: hypothetical protein A2265_12190 [Bacteroidetes bacterium RIFOXYA12_FULL_33_9]